MQTAPQNVWNGLIHSSQYWDALIPNIFTLPPVEVDWKNVTFTCTPDLPEYLEYQSKTPSDTPLPECLKKENGECGVCEKEFQRVKDLYYDYTEPDADDYAFCYTTRCGHKFCEDCWEAKITKPVDHRKCGDPLECHNGDFVHCRAERPECPTCNKPLKYVAGYYQ